AHEEEQDRHHRREDDLAECRPRHALALRRGRDRVVHPMRVAVVSDIHANYHALEAVLAEVVAEQPDEVWCLGDVVGYGPEPNRCTRLVAAHAPLCRAGNHDLAVLGYLSVADFNGEAAAAVRWTQAVLADDA